MLASTPDLINARSDIDFQYDKFQSFRHIDPSIFNDMVFLDKISFLNMEHLESLDEDLFKGLVNLTELVLSNNRLTSLPKSIFRYTKKLAYLSICQQPLKTIDSELFKELHSLGYLSLNDIQLEKFSDEEIFNDLESLYHLSSWE